MAKTFTPHDRVTEGLWYIHTQVAPFYTVVSVRHFVSFGPQGEIIKGRLWVWAIDEEGGHEIEAYDEDQFIGPVPNPLI